MSNGQTFRKYVLPIIVFTVAFGAGYILHQHFHRLFFSLNIVGIIIVAYFSGTAPALFLTMASCVKLLMLLNANVEDSLVFSEEIYGFCFFVMAAALTIYGIHRLKQIAKENLFLRKEQEEVLSVVSHDLRNPLNAIRMNVDLLARQLAKENADGKHLKRTSLIIDICQSMNVLIEELLQLGRLRQKKELEYGPVQLEHFLDRVCQTLGPLAQEKNITLKVINELGMTFKADREKLLRVFSNIAGNAIKFTPEGGTIEIRTERKGREIFFYVRDTGPGIAPDDIPKIFERYWQSGLKARKGMGLGLAIAQSIVESHKGRITLKSTLGIGTTFTIALPVE